MVIRNLQVLLLVVIGSAMFSTAVAATFPDVTLKTDAGAFRFDSLRGKVVYVDFWASWCVPCRRSFPWMNEMQARYKDKDFVIVAISIDSDIASAQRFLANNPANFIIAYDPESISANTLNLSGMPTSFLIDRDGEIVWRHIGFRESDKAENEAKIKEHLAR
jgi:cytochrome c biogenesis protein CcmG, thiol:disulfide interchange protein DsbE